MGSRTIAIMWTEPSGHKSFSRMFVWAGIRDDTSAPPATIRKFADRTRHCRNASRATDSVPVRDGKQPPFVGRKKRYIRGAKGDGGDP